MAKKVSIDFDNDQVVSVKVDGVEYASPEDIPDPEDRARVKALISKSDEAEPDDEFDQAFDREFEKELAEIQKEHGKFPKLFLSIFGAVAVVLLVISVISAVQATRTLAKEVSAPGQVVDLVEHASVDTDTGNTNIFSYPVVEYRLPDGLVKRVEMHEGSSPPVYEVGQAVTVMYDPQQPVNARINSFSSMLLLWILPGITATVGFVFLIVTVVVFRISRSDNLDNGDGGN